MLKARLFYFLYFAGMSSLMPYLAVVYQARGVPGPQIGILTALPPLITMVAAPLWSGLADATNRHKLVLLVLTGGTAAAVAGMASAQSFAVLVPVVALYALCLAPLMPIVDSAVLTALGDRRDDYGRQRIIGSLAPAFVGPAASAISGRFGLQWSFYIFIGCFVLLGALFTTMRIDTVEGSTHFSAGLNSLVRDVGLRRFLIVVFLGMVGYGASITYLYVRLEEVGANPALLGFALTAGALGEMPFLLLSPRLLKRVGARGTLVCSLIAIAVILFGESLARAPWMLVALQLLHGTAFSGMAVAGVAYADEVAPPGLGATAQGMFNAVFSGIGIAVGALVSSIVRDRWSSPVMFQVAGTAAVLGLGLLLVRGRDRDASNRQAESA